MTEYSDQQRTDALTLYEQYGAAGACRLLDFDVSPGTVRVWAHRAGLKRYGPQKVEAAVQAHILRQQELREEMRELALSTAVEMLLRIHETQFVGYSPGGQPLFATPSAKDCQSYSIAYGILNDKYRLEMGEATSRTINEGADDIDRSVVQLVAEMARRGEAETS